jgi:hypothetical protein
MFLLSKEQKTVFAVSFIVCMNLYSQTNNENSTSFEYSNETTTILQEISVKTSKDITGGGQLIR